MPALLLGEVHWADLDPVRGHEQGGIRPVLILSSRRSNERTELAIVLPITGSTPRVSYPYAIPLESVNTEKESWVLTRQIRTIADERMRGYIGRVSNEEMRGVVVAMLAHLLRGGSDIAMGDYPGLV